MSHLPHAFVRDMDLGSYDDEYGPVQVMTEDEARGKGVMSVLEPRNTYVDIYKKPSDNMSDYDKKLLVLEARFHDIRGYPGAHMHETWEDLQRCCSPFGPGEMYPVLQKAHPRGVPTNHYSAKVVNV